MEITKKKIEKYPYIDMFVDAMSSINATEYVAKDDDLKSFMLFMMMYVKAIRELDQRNIPKMNENISERMKYIFQNDRHQYIDILSKWSIGPPPGLPLPNTFSQRYKRNIIKAPKID